MEAGGKLEVRKGLNSGKRRKISLSLAFEIICPGAYLAINFSRISEDTAGILKSVLAGFIFLFFLQQDFLR